MTQTIQIGKQKERGQGYALFLAILPLLIMYRAPFTSMSLTTILVAVGVVFAFIIAFKRYRKIDLGLIFVLSLYLVYVATKSSGLNFLLPIAIIIHIAAISTGAVSEKYIRKYVETISIIAAVCVILQQVFHIIAGIHIPFIYTGWLTDEQSGMSEVIRSGYGLEAMYRPSSFFLEPSHFTQYVIYGLGSVLFQTKFNLKKAILITCGIFATTSGMGFVLAFAIWGWWYITFKKKVKGKNLIPTILFVVLIASILFYAMSGVSFFANIISRFSSDSGSDYNAIEGRLFFWDALFGSENFQSLMFGYGQQALLEQEMYFTGFMKILYAYGVVGVILYFIFWIYMLITMKGLSRMYVIIYIALLFLANQTGFIPIIFNVGTIIVFSRSQQLNKDVI